MYDHFRWQEGVFAVAVRSLFPPEGFLPYYDAVKSGDGPAAPVEPNPRENRVQMTGKRQHATVRRVHAQRAAFESAENHLLVIFLNHGWNQCTARS